MLPRSLFAPLDLQHAVEEVRRTQGAPGVVDLLVVTLTDRRVRSAADIDEHLETLKAACRQTRRYREAIPVLQRIAALDPERRHEVAAEVAMVHWHLGEHATAMSLLDAAIAEHRQLPVNRRSLAFSLVAEVVAMLLRQPALAQECAALGQSTAGVAPARPKAKAKATATRRRAGLARPVLVPEPAAPERAETPARPKQATPPRRRGGLARPVLVPQAALIDADLDQAHAEPTARPRLTLVAGTAA